jgi:hypothetical protein
MFCEDCGEDITQAESQHPGVYQAPAAEAAHIALMIAGAGAPIPLNLESQTVLGRYDADRRQQPDVDLTAYEAFEKGVSGLHAVIQHTTEGVQIVDMGSTNGTYVNGRRLIPDRHYILRDGDEIRLSRLIANIQIAGLA